MGIISSENILLFGSLLLIAGVLIGKSSYRTGLPLLLVFLLVGMVGAPVFTGFQGGMAKVLGPTGGYLAGYIPLITEDSVDFPEPFSPIRP